MTFHRSQIFLCLVLAFIAGIFIGSFFSIPQKAIWILAGICSIVIAIFFRRDSKILNPKIVFLSFCALFLLFGIGRFNLTYPRDHVIEKFAKASADLRNVGNKNKIKITLYGYIAGEPEINGDKQQIIFKSKNLESSSYLLETNERVLIFARLYPQYHFGQELKVLGEPLLPENFSDASGGNFDYVKYLAKDQIYTLMRYPDVQIGGQINLGFWEKIQITVYQKIFTIRQVFEASIDRSISEPAASYINGILLGTRSQIPDSIKQAFNRTGTSHILAISGYNITIVAWVISSILLLFLRRPVAFWFSVAGIILFTVMTGAGASVVRASIMGCLLLYGNKEGRLYGAANAIIFAGAGMVLINPSILRYDVGFQLSFMATLGLIYIVPLLESKLEKLKLPKFLNIKENIIMSVSAQILVLPLLLYYFNNLSIVSIPVNILVLPLVPYTMLLGFIVGLSGLVLPLLGQVIGYFAWFLSVIQLDIVQTFAKPKWAAITVSLSWYWVVIIYLLLVIFLSRILFFTKSSKSK